MTKQELWNNLTLLLVYIVSLVVSNLAYGFVFFFADIQYVNSQGQSMPIADLGIFYVLIVVLVVSILNPLLLSFIVKRIKKHLQNKSKV
jgi:hypothetical protein